jgi:hypothetical protein
MTEKTDTRKRTEKLALSGGESRRSRATPAGSQDSPRRRGPRGSLTGSVEAGFTVARLAERRAAESALVGISVSCVT